MDPIDDRELARYRAHADQLRAGTREALLGMPPSDVADLVSIIARGGLDVLDPTVRQLVCNLALVAIMDFLGVARAEGEV